MKSKEENSLIMEFLEADKDQGNIEIKNDFSSIEEEDFIGMNDFDFKKDKHKK